MVIFHGYVTNNQMVNILDTYNFNPGFIMTLYKKSGGLPHLDGTGSDIANGWGWHSVYDILKPVSKDSPLTTMASNQALQA